MEARTDNWFDALEYIAANLSGQMTMDDSLLEELCKEEGVECNQELRDYLYSHLLGECCFCGWDFILDEMEESEEGMVCWRCGEEFEETALL